MKKNQFLSVCSCLFERLGSDLWGIRIIFIFGSLFYGVKFSFFCDKFI